MKKIILSGKSGFIGKNIFNTLTKLGYSITNINLRKPINEIKDNYNNQNFDIFIHAAGVHPHRAELNEKKVFEQSQELLKKIEPIFSKIKKVILISSFVNLINYDKEVITETNKIYSIKNDNFYKKSKVLTEKYFKMLKKKYRNELITIYPCHVIGPDDSKKSPNGIFLIDNFKKLVSFYPNVNYPITDVREISNFIVYSISNELNSNKKILIDRNLFLFEYFKMLKSYGKKIKFILKVDIRLYYLAHLCFKFIQKILNLKKNPYPISTYYYLRLNPKVIPQTDNNYKIKYKLEKTILDTIKYFEL